MNILKILKDQIGLPKDELIGGWYNGADDGSGLNAIWGYGLEFKSNGKGIYHSWGNDFELDEDETQDSNTETESNIEEGFDWARISDSKVKIKFSKGTNDDWEEIEYEISDFTGAYEAKYFRIVKKGSEKFWSSPTPLYKSKEKY